MNRARPSERARAGARRHEASLMGAAARRPWASLALALLAAAALAPASHAQQPVSQASVQSLVDALSRPAAAGAAGRGLARSFQRTELPDTRTNVCRGAATAGREGGGAGSRNLEVVPYGGDDAARVDLDVRFALDSDALTSGNQSLLDNLAAALQSPQLRAERFAVAGHTDTTGAAKHNLELSCARAIAVRRYLVAKGVAPERLTAYGFGSERLLAQDAPTAPQNRRVEIRRAPGS